MIVHDTLPVDLRMRGGVLRLVTGQGIVVDTDALKANHAQTKIRMPQDPDGPVVLRVELVGHLDFGKVVAEGAEGAAALRGRWRPVAGAQVFSDGTGHSATPASDLPDPAPQPVGR